MFYVFSKKCLMDFWLFSFVMVFLSYGGLKPLKTHQIWVIFDQKMEKKQNIQKSIRQFLETIGNIISAKFQVNPTFFLGGVPIFVGNQGTRFWSFWGIFGQNLGLKSWKIKKKIQKNYKFGLESINIMDSLNHNKFQLNWTTCWFKTTVFVKKNHKISPNIYIGDKLVSRHT